MTFGDFKNEITRVIENRPKNWRKGQTVFNYIESKYDVARSVQYSDKTDRFYDDSKTEEPIKAAYKRIINS